MRRGFTLLEVLVATLIMGVAVVGLLSGLQTSLRSASRLTEYDRAVMLARSKMDELLVDTRIPQGATVEGQFAPAETGGEEGGWKAQFSLLEGPQPSGPGSHVLETVDLEVWWMAGGRRRSFPLQAYRTSTIPRPGTPQ